MPASDSVYINIIADATKAIAGIAKLGVAYVAITKIARTVIKIVNDVVGEYQKQELAEAKLASAIKATGKEGLISAKNIGRLASQLQKTTTFADDTTIAAAAMLQQLANLDEQGLQQIIPRIQNFAAAMGIDLEQAATLVGKTLGSSMNALGRYGIQIDASASKSTKLSQLTRELDSKFSAMAATLGTTATGQIIIFQNALSDLKEVAGEVFLRGIGPMVQNIIPILQRMNDSLSGMRLYKSILSPEGFSAAISSLGKAKEAMDAVNEEIKRTEGLLKTLGRYRGPEEERLKQLRNRLAMLQQVIPLLEQQERFDKKPGPAKSFDPAAAENARKLADGVQAATNAWNEFIEAELEIVSGFPAVNNAFLGLTDMVSGFSDEMEEKGLLELENYEEKVIDTTDAVANLVRMGQLKIDWLRTSAEAAEEAERALAKYKDQAQAAVDAMAPFADAIGMMAIDSKKGWEMFAEAAKGAISKVLEMLAEEAFVRAAIQWGKVLSLDFTALPGAIAWTAAGTAALVASGAVKAMAEGGVVTRPTTALIGEAGPEAVIPLNKMGGMGTNISIHVYGSVMEEEGLARKIGSIVSRQRRGY